MVSRAPGPVLDPVRFSLPRSPSLTIALDCSTEVALLWFSAVALDASACGVLLLFSAVALDASP